MTAAFGGRVDRLKAMDVSGPSTTYPHVSVSWLAIQSPDPLLESAKLRVGWARTGNFASIDLTTPEITSEVEGGADALALNGALQVSVTGYGRRSRALNDIPVPPGGTESVLGTIENTGIIIVANLRLVRSARIDWDAQLGLWGDRNRATGFTSATNIGSQLIENGYPVGSYFSPGILGYRDANGDGVIEAGEVQVSGSGYVGNPFPTQGATLGTTLRVGRGIRAGLLFEYRAGNQLLNLGEVVRCEDKVCAGVNTNAPLADQAAAAVAGLVTGPYTTSGNFLKIRELSASIAAPDSWARAIRCTGATLTLAGRNLLTWTSYRGLDPEINSTGAVGLGVADLFTQPPVRTLAARVDLAF